MAERGVTLIELMACIVIIGIFVALASPAMSGVLQDRHAMRAADDISGLIRLARTRSSATGSAHMIRATGSGSTMKFELRAAVNTTSSLGGPISSCITPQWVDTDSVQVAMLDFTGANKNYSYVGRDIIVRPVDPTPPAQDFCYTPGGSAWWRTAGVWTRPLGNQVTRYEVVRLDSVGSVLGISRTVRISPLGVPTIEAK